MKKIAILYTMFFIAMTMVGCQKEQHQAFEGEGSDMVFSMNVSANTRTNPLGESAASAGFNDGDRVNVSAAGDAMAANIFYSEYTYSAASGWGNTAGGKLMWLQENYYIRAYYPVTNGTGMDINGKQFTVPTVQNTLSTIANADYMTYSAEHSILSGRVIEPILQRQMAKVVIEIKENLSGIPTESLSLTINSKYSSYTDDELTGVATEITPYFDAATNSYVALVLPDKATDVAAPNGAYLENFIKLITEGPVSGTPLMQISGRSSKLDAGKSYKFTLSVGPGGKLYMDMNSLVGSWYENEHNFGRPEPVAPVVGDVYYSDGSYAAQKIAGKNDADILGVVAWVDPAITSAPWSAKIMSLDEARLLWATSDIGKSATDRGNGRYNMRGVYTDAGDTFDIHPAFKWCHDKNSVDDIAAAGGVMSYYTDNAKNVWYLPSFDEMLENLTLYHDNDDISSSVEGAEGQGLPHYYQTDPSRENYEPKPEDYYTVITAIQNTMNHIGVTYATPLSLDFDVEYPTEGLKFDTSYHTSWSNSQFGDCTFFVNFGVSGTRRVQFAFFGTKNYATPFRVRAMMEVECNYVPKS